jgi:hypothetical protein
MRVDWIILCRYCEVNPGGATIIGGGFDGMAVPAVPSPIQFMAAVRLVFQEGEAQVQHRITANVLDPAMEEISAPFDTTFMARRGPAALAGWEAAATVPMMLRFMAQTAGAYTINIAVDGRSQSITFVVNVGSQPPAPAG